LILLVKSSDFDSVAPECGENSGVARLTELSRPGGDTNTFGVVFGQEDRNEIAMNWVKRL
jgi:hypothetical protein